MHPVDRFARTHEVVQRLQHEAVATERDDHVGRGGRRAAIRAGKLAKCLLRLGNGACDESDALVSRCRGAHDRRGIVLLLAGNNSPPGEARNRRAE